LFGLLYSLWYPFIHLGGDRKQRVIKNKKTTRQGAETKYQTADLFIESPGSGQRSGRNWGQRVGWEREGRRGRKRGKMKR